MTIFIPTPLRPYTDGLDTVEVDAATLAEALAALTHAHPSLRKHLFTPEGKLRAFVNLYLNNEDVRYLPGKDATAVTAADTLSIIPSIAGGVAVQAIEPSPQSVRAAELHLQHENWTHGNPY